MCIHNSLGFLHCLKYTVERNFVQLTKCTMKDTSNRQETIHTKLQHVNDSTDSLHIYFDIS